MRIRKLSIIVLCLLYICSLQSVCNSKSKSKIHNYHYIFLCSDFSLHQFLGLMDGSILLGPWGGHGGFEWNDGIHSGVREITLVYGSCIDSIRVTYDNNGKPFLAEKHGGFGGMKSTQIKLQYPEEILVSVSGHYSRVVYGGNPVIRSLTFKTNKRTFGPFGVEEGTPFDFLSNGGHIVGFTGRGGWFLDSLGFYLSSPKPNLSQRFNIMLKALKDLTILLSKMVSITK